MINHELVPIIAILSTIALPVVLGTYIVINSLRVKHKERMELIKQGIIPPEKTATTPNKYRSLRNGFLCISIAVGMILSLLIARSMDLNNDEAFWVVVPGVLLFLGIAYVAFYMVTNKKKDLDSDLE